MAAADQRVRRHFRVGHFYSNFGAAAEPPEQAIPARLVPMSTESSTGSTSQNARTASMRDMFDRIAARYDLMNRVLSLGMDAGWRRKAVAGLQLSPGSTVLDLACGTGALSKELLKAGMKPVGFDISEQMLRQPLQEQAIAEQTDKTVPAAIADCLRLPMGGASVQGVICGFALRHFVSVKPLLAEAARVLVPHGRLVLLELDKPDPWLLRAGHRLYSRTFIPLAGRVLSEKSAYEYLPDSLALLPDPEQFEADLREAGFADINRRSLSLGIAQMVSASRA